MDKKIKTWVVIVGAYLLVFWIGFNSGAIYLRMQKKMQTEIAKMPILPQPPPPVSYYILEKRNYGSYVDESIREVFDTDPYIKILKNDKLRMLLKDRDLAIYKDTGERIY